MRGELTESAHLDGHAREFADAPVQFSQVLVRQRHHMLQGVRRLADRDDVTHLCELEAAGPRGRNEPSSKRPG